MWLSDEWAEKHNIRRDCRLQMGGAPHHQGNRNLGSFAEAWSQSHHSQECNEFMAYALTHKGKATAPNNTYNPADGPEAYSNASTNTKLTEYTSAARQRYGEDFNPASQPLDTDLLMRLGAGKPHGRYMMAGSTIDSTCVANLAHIRATSTDYSFPIRARQPSSQQQMAAIQAELERLSAQTQAQQLEMARVQAQREAEQQRMQDMFTFMASLQSVPGVVVPPLLLAPVTPAAGTPPQSFGSNPTPHGGPSPQTGHGGPSP